MLLSFVGARRRRRALWPSGTQPASPEICLRLSCWSCASCISYHMLIKEPQTGRQRQTQHCKTEHLTHVCETNALQRQLCLLWFVPIAKNPHSIHCIPPLPIYLGKRRVVAGLCIGDLMVLMTGRFPKMWVPPNHPSLTRRCSTWQRLTAWRRNTQMPWRAPSPTFLMTRESSGDMAKII